MNKPISVLLIEDNPADAELTKELLESDKLHLVVHIASDGEQALRLLLPSPQNPKPLMPDLILLDINLPKLDGRAVLHEIRTRDELKKVPVVILSSSDAEQDIARSYDLGANCYITKPVGLNEFQNIVRSVQQFWFTVVKLPSKEA